MLDKLCYKYQVHNYKQKGSENAMYRTSNLINNAVDFLPICQEVTQIKPSLKMLCAKKLWN